MKKSLIIFILFILPLGVWAQEGSIEPVKKRKSLLIFPYKKFQTSASMNIPIQDKHKVFKLRAGNGALLLIPNSKNELDIEARIYLTSLGKKTAQRFIKRFSKISLQESGEELYLRSYFNLERKRKRFTVEGDTEVSTISIGGFMGTPAAKIDLVVKVPPGLDVKVYDGSGDTEIQGLSNDLYVRDQSGDIFINAVTGNLEVRDGSGKIRIQDAGADTYVRDGAGKIYISGSKSNVKIIDGSGHLEVLGVNGNLDVKDASGAILIKDVGGGLTLKDSSGTISLEEIANGAGGDTPVKITDASGHIYMKNVNGKLQLKDRSGKVIKR